MKLSKVFVVVVALHALLIGSIFYIGGCRTRGVQVVDQPAVPYPGPEYRVPPPPPPITVPPTTRRPSPPVIRPADIRPPRVTTAPPSPRATGGEQEYVIEAGDTIWSISQRYGVSMQEVLDRNGMTEESAGRIRVGQKIVLPRGASPAPARPPARPPVDSAAPKTAAPTPATPPPALTDGAYTVQAGDSLWTISRRYGTTIEAIRQANQLTSDLLRPGQQLVIPGAAAVPAPPSSAPEPDAAPPRPPEGSAAPPAAPPAQAAGIRKTETYYLEPNETLADVARKHGISLEELLRLNGMTDPNQVKSFEPVLVPLAGE